MTGYVEVKKANPEPNCIQVHYSVRYNQPTFAEEVDHRGLFNFKPDTSPAWEVSFYASLRQVDGLLMLGGGPSSMTAGVVAMGHGKPICAVASFGGYSKKIWELLPVQQKLLTAEEIFAMAEQWRPELAKRYVEILLRQLDQLARAEQEEAEEVARAQESFRQQLAEKDEKLKLELDRQSESLKKAFAEQIAAERKAQRLKERGETLRRSVGSLSYHSIRPVGLRAGPTGNQFCMADSTPNCSPAGWRNLRLDNSSRVRRPWNRGYQTSRRRADSSTSYKRSHGTRWWRHNDVDLHHNPVHRHRR